MGMVPLVCPQCGANVELDNSREFGFCSYCGTKIMQDKIVVAIDGISTAENLLERANIFLKNARFREAKEYYNKVLDTNAKCAGAHWGLLLCKYYSANDEVFIDNMISARTVITNIAEYKNAVEFASGDEAKRYSDVANRIAESISKTGSLFRRKTELEASIEKYEEKIRMIKTGALLVETISLFTYMSSAKKLWIFWIFFLGIIALQVVFTRRVNSAKALEMNELYEVNFELEKMNHTDSENK